MFSWFKSKEIVSKSKIDDIVQLMKHRPLEWEFSGRNYLGYNDWRQEVNHKKTGLSLTLKFDTESGKVPTAIRFNAAGQVALTGKESSLLIEAVDNLRHSRFNAVAAQYLKLEAKIECCQCKSKVLGWAWICKCQSLMDQNCYGNANVCPACGGSLVGD